MSLKLISNASTVNKYSDVTSLVMSCTFWTLTAVLAAVPQCPEVVGALICTLFNIWVIIILMLDKTRLVSIPCQLGKSTMVDIVNKVEMQIWNWRLKKRRNKKKYRVHWWHPYEPESKQAVFESMFFYYDMKDWFFRFGYLWGYKTHVAAPKKNYKISKSWISCYSPFNSQRHGVAARAAQADINSHHSQ